MQHADHGTAHDTDRETDQDTARHRTDTRNAYDRLADVWSATTDDGPYNGGPERPALRSLVPQPLAVDRVREAGPTEAALRRWPVELAEAATTPSFIVYRLLLAPTTPG